MDPRPDPADVMSGWATGASGTVVHEDRIVHVEHVWNTAVSIHLQGTAGREAQARTVLEDCARWFAEVDGTFSTYRPESEVTFYRNGLGWSVPHSPDFEEVVGACRRLRSATRGGFDPWAVPGGFDPSGYVKGWAAGRASGLLTRAGFADHLVNAGGDICASGDQVPGSGSGWLVGIAHPHSALDIVASARLRNGAMATSGSRYRGHHVVDPVTGGRAVGVDSATVVGPDAGVADALASAAFVHAERSLEWLTALGPEWSLFLVTAGTGYAFGPAFEGPTPGA